MRDKFFIKIVFCLHSIFLVSCDFEVRPENALQKKRVYALEKELNTRTIKSRNGEILLIGSLQNYQNSCLKNDPIIEHQHCLSILVEGSTSEIANDNVRLLVTSLMTSKLSDSLSSLLAGSTAVFIAGVRTENYKGEITPYAANNSFKTNKPYLLKLEK